MGRAASCVGAIAIVLLTVMSAACAEELCFEDVVVSGAGPWWVNGTASFVGMYNDHPWFLYTAWEGGAYHVISVRWIQRSWHVGWSAEGTIDTGGVFCAVWYLHDQPSETPPCTGWILGDIISASCGGVSPFPVPTLSGGRPCSARHTDRALAFVVPVVGSRILDADAVEPHEEAVAGELPVQGIYEAGQPITGCARTVDAAGDTISVPYLTLTLYAVIPGEEFDTRTPLLAGILMHGKDAESFCFAIETLDLAPGYYDIRLGVPFMGLTWIRVELAAASATHLSAGS